MQNYSKQPTPSSTTAPLAITTIVATTTRHNHHHHKSQHHHCSNQNPSHTQTQDRWPMTHAPRPTPNQNHYHKPQQKIHHKTSITATTKPTTHPPRSQPQPKPTTLIWRQHHKTQNRTKSQPPPEIPEKKSNRISATIHQIRPTTSINWSKSQSWSTIHHHHDSSMRRRRENRWEEKKKTTQPRWSTLNADAQTGQIHNPHNHCWIYHQITN